MFSSRARIIIFLTTMIPLCISLSKIKFNLLQYFCTIPQFSSRFFVYAFSIVLGGLLQFFEYTYYSIILDKNMNVHRRVKIVARVIGQCINVLMLYLIYNLYLVRDTEDENIILTILINMYVGRYALNILMLSTMFN